MQRQFTPIDNAVFLQYIDTFTYRIAIITILLKRNSVFIPVNFKIFGNCAFNRV